MPCTVFDDDDLPWDRRRDYASQNVVGFFFLIIIIIVFNNSVYDITMHITIVY